MTLRMSGEERVVRGKGDRSIVEKVSSYKEGGMRS